MKTLALSLTLLIVMCFFFLPETTRAQDTPAEVDGYTSIDFDPDTNIVTAYSETDIVDYDLESDYEAYVYLRVTNDSGINVASGSNRDYNGVLGYAYVTLEVSGDPATTYTAYGTHKLYVLLYDDYWDYDYYPYRHFYDYWDNWYFGYFESFTVYEPWWYAFYRPYFAPVTRRNRYINKGTTYDSASVTTPRPHHLRVISDDTFVRDCGALERRIVYQVVDVNERSTGLTPTSESYAPVTDTCNGSTVRPSSCSFDNRDGTFTDRLTVDCPSSGGSCGFEVNASWYWCPRGRTPKRLATIPYVIHHDRITVNGIDQLNPGTDFEP